MLHQKAVLFLTEKKSSLPFVLLLHIGYMLCELVCRLTGRRVLYASASLREHTKNYLKYLFSSENYIAYKPLCHHANPKRFFCLNSSPQRQRVYQKKGWHWFDSRNIPLRGLIFGCQDCCKRDQRAVSYTHLDVYKRQLQVKAKSILLLGFR